MYWVKTTIFVLWKYTLEEKENTQVNCNNSNYTSCIELNEKIDPPHTYAPLTSTKMDNVSPLSPTVQKWNHNIADTSAAMWRQQRDDLEPWGLRSSNWAVWSSYTSPTQSSRVQLLIMSFYPVFIHLMPGPHDNLCELWVRLPVAEHEPPFPIVMVQYTNPLFFFRK